MRGVPGGCTSLSCYLLRHGDPADGVFVLLSQVFVSPDAYIEHSSDLFETGVQELVEAYEQATAENLDASAIQFSSGRSYSIRYYRRAKNKR